MKTNGTSQKTLQDKQRATFKKMQKKYQQLCESSNLQLENKNDDIEALRKQIQDAKEKLQEETNNRKQGIYAAPFVVQAKIYALSARMDMLIRQKEERDFLKPSANIEQIIMNLAEGKCDDLRQAKAIISSEAQKELDERTAKATKMRGQNPQFTGSTKAPLTLEKHENILFTQIAQILEKRASDYKVREPNQTISQMMRLMGKEEIFCASVVFKNLVANREYGQAKTVAEHYKKQDWLQQTRNHQFGDWIANLMQMREPSDNLLNEFFEKIGSIQEEAWRQRKKADFTLIPLGTDKSGTRITLARIYTDKELDRYMGK